MLVYFFDESPSVSMISQNLADEVKVLLLLPHFFETRIVKLI